MCIQVKTCVDTMARANVGQLGSFKKQQHVVDYMSTEIYMYKVLKRLFLKRHTTNIEKQVYTP